MDINSNMEWDGSGLRLFLGKFQNFLKIAVDIFYETKSPKWIDYKKNPIDFRIFALVP